MQTQQNNGNNGNKKKKQKVMFITLKIRHDVAERFKYAAMNNELNQSEFLDQLLKSKVFDEIFNDPQNRDAIQSFMRHIARRAMESQSTDFTGYKF